MPHQADDLTTRFTLLCLQARFNPATLKAAQALTPRLDWEAWFDSARASGLTPLLYIIVHGRGVVPAAVEARLEAGYYRSARDNALRFHELGESLAALAGARIQTLLLKGAALAEPVYGNIAVRPMADFDVLVRPEDVEAALAALAQRSYRGVEGETQAGAAIAFESQIALSKPGPVETIIEIHWSLLDSPHHQHRLPMAWFWDTAAVVEVEGSATRVLGPEALLLHLCAHLALHHHGTGLLWLHDVAEVLHLHGDRLDWDLLLAKAAQCDLVLPLQQVVPRVVEEWGVSVPHEIQGRLRDLKPTPEEARIFNWLTATRRPVAQRFYADLASMPGWRARLRYAAGNLFPSAAYMRRRYGIRHGILLPLYYPYRWLIGLRSAAHLLGKRRTGV